MIQHLLHRLESWLSVNRRDYFTGLQAGVTTEQLDAFEAQFSLKLPQAFRELYAWRNGQKEGNYKSFVGNRMFMSLGEIVTTKDMLDGMIGYDFDDPNYWRRTWIPFLSNGGGSYLCLDVLAEDGETVGQLIGFWKADEDRNPEYSSIEEWLADLVDMMESGELEVY